MGKKSLVVGIILISISIFIIIAYIGAGSAFCNTVSCWEGTLLSSIIFSLPVLIGGLFLLGKHFRSRKKEERFSISQNNQDNSKKYEPKTNDETQFWVCPVCGKDTKELHGKSYCDNCQRYL